MRNDKLRGCPKQTAQIVLLFIGFWLLMGSLSFAAIPHLINYQGRLTDPSGNPLNGTYALTFRIYDAQSAGNLLWEETHSGVVIQKGVFSILLGSVASLNLAFDKPYFLEIKVGTEVMSPRQQITSAGYAFMAENVLSVPRGVITLWSGRIAEIPAGWALCDGSQGTPDLRDKFIVGARQDEDGLAKTNISGSLSQSGGSTSISVSNLPPHTHSIHLEGNYGQGQPAQISACGPTETYVGSTSSGSTGSGTAYVQPYYALAYIMKL